MKIHLLTIGFTEEVFRKPLMSRGADRVIAIHSPRETDEVARTLRELRSWGLDVEEKVLDDSNFRALVPRMLALIESQPREAELFAHIGGGERHMALALLYATFFAGREMEIIVTTRIKEGDKTTFEHDSLPALHFQRTLSAPKRKIMRILRRPMRLSEIVRKLGGNPEREMPRVFQLLKTLKKDGFVGYDSETKLYEKTVVGEMVG